MPFRSREEQAAAMGKKRPQAAESQPRRLPLGQASKAKKAPSTKAPFPRKSKDETKCHGCGKSYLEQGGHFGNFLCRQCSKPKTSASPSPKQGKPAITAGRANVLAQLRRDFWLVNELRRRNPAAFMELDAQYPRNHTNLLAAHPETWSPEEVEDTKAFIRDAETYLIAHANTLPDQARGRLIMELNLQDAAMQQSQRCIRMNPKRLQREIEEYERLLRWTPGWNHHERRRFQLMLNATRREARRRGLRGEPRAL